MRATPPSTTAAGRWRPSSSPRRDATSLAARNAISHSGTAKAIGGNYGRVGDTVLLHSDGLVEAHDPERKMFGFPRLAELMNGCSGGPELIQLLLGELDGFTGPD